MAHEYINSKKLARRIAELQAELAKLLHLESFVGSTGKKRGRKPGRAKGATAIKGTRKRKPVKATVLRYLEKNRQGKAIEIARLSGLKVTSVHQTLFGLKKSGHVTQSKKRGSPFVLVKK